VVVFKDDSPDLLSLAELADEEAGAPVAEADCAIVWSKKANVSRRSIGYFIRRWIFYRSDFVSRSGDLFSKIRKIIIFSYRILLDI